MDATTALWSGISVLFGCVGCVPEGPSTESKAEPRPSTTVTPTVRSLDPPLAEPFRDDFERETLGPAYRPLSERWTVSEGQLCVRAARNRGVWLRRRLPRRVRIAFDARADSKDGDIKIEVFGDGRTGATKTTYDDATSYLLIFGGWNNSRHVLARLDEHATDRLVAAVTTGGSATPDAPLRERPVEPHRAYRFRIERADDQTLRWWIDDELIHEHTDDAPLSGRGHDHFGFNDWDAPVCFDNLEVTPL